MSSFAKSYFSVTNPDELLALESNVDPSLRFYLYWKDKNRKYCGTNDRLARCFGFERGSDVASFSDTDFVSPASYQCLKQHDTQIIHNALSKIFFEPITHQNGEFFNLISFKMPWYTQSGKIHGLLGISIATILFDNVYEHKIQLSQRQIDCLYYLVKGYSAKETAKVLTLSHRTVEHYLETVKNKLNCFSRSELISAALTIPDIKHRL